MSKKNKKNKNKLQRQQDLVSSNNGKQQLNSQFQELLNSAQFLQKEGKLHEACASYENILSLYPQHPEIHYYLGGAWQQQGKIADAIQAYQQGLALAPNYFPQVYYNLGVLYKQQGKLTEAIRAYEKFISLYPDNALVYNSLGRALQQQGKVEAAIAAYEQAIKLNYSYYQAFDNLGNALLVKGKIEEAIAAHQQAINVNPNYAPAYNNLGNGLHAQGKIEAAITAYRKAINLNPNYGEAFDNLGVALQKQEKWEEATTAHRQALTLNPGLVSAYNNIGHALQEQGKLEEAMACYQKGLTLNPHQTSIHLHYGSALLQQGNFSLGWEEYQWRLQKKQYQLKSITTPFWDGKTSLTDKTILIKAEQGLGDLLQFSRYVPLLATRGAKVILESPESLVSVMKTLPGIDKVVSRTEVNEVDFLVWLMSLPYFFQTTVETIPPTVPYLSAPETSRASLLNENRFKIGIVWSSKLINPTSRKRSCPLELFASILAGKDIDCYSLQKEPTAADLDLLTTLPIVDLKEQLQDFGDTAGIIAQLDLVISVDTSVAHLAGGMGKPVWVLLPAVPEWRWLLDREDSPWYPTMRLFRQTEPGDWSMVLKQVENALSNLLE